MKFQFKRVHFNNICTFSDIHLNNHRYCLMVFKLGIILIKRVVLEWQEEEEEERSWTNI